MSGTLLLPLALLVIAAGLGAVSMGVRSAKRARALGFVLMRLTTAAAPAAQRSDIRVEVGSMIDAAARQGDRFGAVVHGASAVRTVRPRSLAVAIGVAVAPNAPWKVWLFVAATAGLVLQFGVESERVALFAHHGLKLVTVALMAWALLCRGLGARRAWCFITGGVVLFVAGDIVFHIVEPRSFPSLIDGFYLAMYPLLVLGLAVLFGSSAPDRWARWFAAAVAGGAFTAGVLLWMWLAGSDLRGLSSSARLVALGYPSLDVVVLILACGLVASASQRRARLALVAGAAASLALGDIGYNIALLNDSFDASHPVRLLWVGFFAFIAAAALYPECPRSEHVPG